MSSIERLREWLLADTLPVWLEKGYDRANRSFHERLNLDFSPVTEGGKRVLVQARQRFALQPGMALNAEIKLQKRTIFQLIFSRLNQTTDAVRTMR